MKLRPVPGLWFVAALAAALIAGVGNVLLSRPAFPQQQILVPTRPLGDNSNAAASTAFVQNFLLGPAALPVQIGPLPWVQVNTYVAGSTNALLLAVRGTIASPITDNAATAIFQSVSSETTGTGGTTLYASINKRNTAAIDNRAAWFEAVDTAGGGSLAGLRSTCTMFTGTGGNCSGSTNVGISIVPYAFLVGAENQVFNNVADATTTFSSAAFEAPVLSSCAGTKRCFAGFLVNPNGTVPDINGFYAAAGTVSDSVVRSDATATHAINLNLATCSTDCWLGPGGSSKITGVGAISSGVSGGASGSLTLNGATSGNGAWTVSATGGHITPTSSSTPTLTAGCNGAGSAVSGNDTIGTITGQTAAATTCTLTFGTAFGATPKCLPVGLSSPLTGAITPSTGTLVVNFASTANYQFTYMCFGT